MKKLLIALALTHATSAHATSALSACHLTLKARSPKAKTASLGTTTFSTKQLQALREHCIVDIQPMTKAEKIEAYKARLEREELKEQKAIASK